MNIKLKKGVKPFRIHNGKEWKEIKDGVEVTNPEYNAIKSKVTKVKAEPPKENKDELL